MEWGWRHSPTEILIDHHGRRHSAVSRTRHLFHRETLCLRAVSNSHAHEILDRTKDAPAVVGHAGFAHADSNEVTACRLSSEIGKIGQGPATWASGTSNTCAI
ncbi:MAG: hypothetical protein ABI604_20700 [Nitrospirota bacterium]